MANVAAWLKALVLVLVYGLTGVSAFAQDDSRRPLRVIVPLSPGGAVDVGARILAPHIEARLRQPVIVENRPGGNNAIGAQVVATAPADGLTLFFTAVGTTTPVFIKDFPLDFMRDFEPVAPVWKVAYMLFISSAVPAKNFREFVDYAKANPGKLNYGAASGSTMMAMEMLKARAGLDIVPVPYKGSAPALTALVANEIQAVFDVAGLHKQHVDAGRERAMYAADKQRNMVFPDVPTAEEYGLTDLEVLLTGGYWAKTGAPKSVVARINAAVNEVLGMQEVIDRFKAAGWVALKGTPEDLRQKVRAEMDFWAKAAKVANYKAE